MSKPDILWKGQSDENYGYWIHKIGTKFKSEPGNYIYAKETKPGYWYPIYIGQTSNLAERLANHNEEQCASRNGATHIHAHTSSSSEATRKAEEKDLLVHWKPTCNSQGV